MTPRAFLSLLFLTLIAVVGAIVVLVVEQSNVVAADRGGDLMFPELGARMGDVTQVTVEARRYTLTLERRGDQWLAINRGDYPVRAEPIDQLLTAMAQVTEFEPRTDNPERYAELDVEGPGPGREAEDMHFTAQTADGTVLADAIVGAPSQSIGATHSGTFVRRFDEERTWLVDGAVFFPNYLPEWFDNLFSVPGPEVGRVTIFAGDSMLFDASKVDFVTGDYVLDYLDPAFQRPNIEAEDNAIRNLAQAIVSTTFDDAVPRETIVVPADARTVRFETRGGLGLSITLVPDGDRMLVLYEASAPAGSADEALAASIRQRTENWAFELPGNRIVTLTRDIALLVRVPPQAAPAPLGPGEVAPLGPLIPGIVP